MAIYFDLTDVAAHASFSNALSGIQRVQLEYVCALVRQDNHQINMFANLYGVYVDLDALFSDGWPDGAEATFDQMRRLFGPLSPFGRLRRTFAEARANGAMKIRSAAAVLRQTLVPSGGRFGPRDCLYVGGAFWAHPRSVATYEQAVRDGCDVVVLFHDILPMAHPDLADSGCRPLFERMLRLRSRALTVSRHSQTQIERARRAIGAPCDLCPPIVAPLAHEFSAAPRNFVGREPPSGRVAALQRSEPFVLCVGSIEARKNQLPLIGLWERLAREMGPPWPRLVIAGRRGWRAGDTLRVLNRADAATPYAWVDTPTDEELAWLYSHARFTVFQVSLKGGACLSARACGSANLASPPMPPRCRRSVARFALTRTRAQSTASQRRSSGSSGTRISTTPR